MMNGAHPKTRMIHWRTEAGDAMPAVTPLFQSSAFGVGSPYFYTRKNNPNIAEFEESVCIMEGANHGVALSTGMAAIKICLDIVRPGQAILLSQLLYGCTVKLVKRHCERYGIRLIQCDLTVEDFEWDTDEDVAMAFFETPTNPFLRTIDIAAVASRIKAKHPKALVVVDNTWATPVFQRPLDFGADLSLHSATKYMSGHSDVMGGIVLANDGELADRIREERFYSGMVMDPFAAWLLRRSINTIYVRLEAQSRTTERLVEHLKTLSKVAEVYFPRVDGTQLTGYGGIIFVQLKDAYEDSFSEIVSNLSCFATGTGMACVSSMIAQPYTGSHASMSDAEKAVIGLNKGLIRFCFGLERPEDLIADLEHALGPASAPRLEIAARA
jgi:cystathionine gamma-lyase/cystathionine gamma-lyase/homocysteine desulfhydrase